MQNYNRNKELVEKVAPNNTIYEKYNSSFHESSHYDYNSNMVLLE